MRVSYFPLFGVLAGLAASLAIAATPPAHPKTAPAAPRCGCHVRREVSRVHRRGRVRVWRQAAAAPEHYGHMGEHMWRGERRWGEEQGWADEHGWGEREGRWAYGHEDDRDLAWAERPWATDRFGYLTWPGKTHFVEGHPVAEPPPPPPPDGGPPPPADWEGPPPPPGADEQSYDVYRF